MAEDEAATQNVEPGKESDEFELALEAAIAVAYPTLCQRLERAGFAGWHRRCRQLDDLAQQALFEFLRHCRRNRILPNDSLRYLVAIARNVAKRQYAVSRTKPLDIACVLPQSLPEPISLLEDSEFEERPRLEQNVLADRVRAAMECLPQRQREALELRIREPDATDRELGRKMKISEDGFRKNVDRAYARLRQIFDTTGLS